MKILVFQGKVKKLTLVDTFFTVGETISRCPGMSPQQASILGSFRGNWVTDLLLSGHPK